MFKILTKSTRINFRAADGLGAFPNETPLWLQAKQHLTAFADPVPVPPIPGNYILALDISKWNPFFDYSLIPARGIKAVWIKANQGAWVDSLFETHVRGLSDVGVEIGFYDFLDPPQGVSAKESATTHYNLTKGLVRLSSWMDAERAGSLDRDGLLDYYKEWYETLAGLTNDERVIENYTRMSFWNDKVQRSNYWMNNQVELNAARYHLGLKSPWSDGNFTPRDWAYGLNEFHLWQYSADGNGMGAYFGCESNSVDINAFSGSWDDFQKHYGLEDEPEPPPACCDQIVVLTKRVNDLEQRVSDLENGNQPPTDYDTEMIVTAEPNLRLRSEPIDGETIVGIPTGAHVWITRDEQVPVSSGNWVKTKYGALEGWAADWHMQPVDDVSEPGDTKTVRVTRVNGAPAFAAVPGDKLIIEINVYAKTQDPDLKWNLGETLLVGSQAVTADGGTKWYIIEADVNKHGYDELYIRKDFVVMV